MGAVAEYLSGLEGEQREAVARVLGRAAELVPDAEEGHSYGMATLRYRGKPLISALARKSHIGVYPFSSSAIAALSGDLAGVVHSKGAIQFTTSAPLSDDLLDRLILTRRDEIDASA
jgi:uncharacterized protein YdhG (YjbR/CyaY superfamily)